MISVDLFSVSSTLPVSQQPPLTPNKKSELQSSNILQSYNRQINNDNEKFKQEEVCVCLTGRRDTINRTYFDWWQPCFFLSMPARSKSQWALEWNTRLSWSRTTWRASMPMNGTTKPKVRTAQLRNALSSHNNHARLFDSAATSVLLEWPAHTIYSNLY